MLVIILNKHVIFLLHLNLAHQVLTTIIYRRMQRFFAGQYFDYRQISQLIFKYVFIRQIATDFR